MAKFVRQICIEGLEKRQLLTTTSLHYDIDQGGDIAWSTQGSTGDVIQDGSPVESVTATISNLPKHKMIRVDPEVFFGAYVDFNDTDSYTITVDGKDFVRGITDDNGTPEALSTPGDGRWFAHSADSVEITLRGNGDLEPQTDNSFGLLGVSVGVYNPTVSIFSSGGPMVEEDPDAATTFTVVRDLPASHSVANGDDSVPALDVSLNASGDATDQVDYVDLPSALNIPAGETSASATIHPVDDDEYEPEESIQVSIEDSQKYEHGGPASSSIGESDKVAGVNVEGETYKIGETKDITVLVTDTYGNPMAGQFVQLSNYDSNIIQPPGISGTTGADGIAHFQILGYGEGNSNLAASVTQPGTTQPTIGSATQTVKPIMRSKEWSGINVDVVDNVAQKIMDALAPNTNSRIKAAIQEKANAIANDLATKALSLTDHTIERKVGEEVFDTNNPDVTVGLRSLGAGGVKASMSAKVLPAATIFSADMKAKTVTIQLDIDLDIDIDLGDDIKLKANLSVSVKCSPKTITASSGRVTGTDQ